MHILYNRPIFMLCYTIGIVEHSLVIYPLLNLPYKIGLYMYLLLVLLELYFNFTGKSDAPDPSPITVGSESWDYVTVRPEAHMFYWLYRTTHKAGYKNRPLILWLQVRL